jgi:AcrR family transcriptional regulator
VTAVRGRRPGSADTRSEIVEAARATFAEDGYAKASIRSIARRAKVDPALVHHYFADKATLFAQTMALPADPKDIAAEASAGRFSGERLIERFLAQWERDGDTTSVTFAGLAQAMAASPAVADNVRQFVIERIGLHGMPGDSEETLFRRRSLISSQLLGLAWTRYVMRLEPMASAPRSEVARWAGPTIDRYITASFD